MILVAFDELKKFVESPFKTRVTSRPLPPQLTLPFVEEVDENEYSPPHPLYWYMKLKGAGLSLLHSLQQRWHAFSHFEEASLSFRLLSLSFSLSQRILGLLDTNRMSPEEWRRWLEKQAVDFNATAHEMIATGSSGYAAWRPRDMRKLSPRPAAWSHSLRPPHFS